MSPSSSVHIAHQPRDTGFPEPFSSRTTTLPHPEADLSPNACIGQEDVHVDFARKHSGLSFLHRSKKPKKTTTLVHGALGPSASANRSAVSLVAGQSAVSLASAANNSPPRTRERSTSSSGSRHHQPRERSSSGSNHGQPLRRPHSNSQPSIVETPPSPTGSKYVRDSFATTRRDEEETPPTSPDDASVKSSRRLFNKFRRH